MARKTYGPELEPEAPPAPPTTKPAGKDGLDNVERKSVSDSMEKFKDALKTTAGEMEKKPFSMRDAMNKLKNTAGQLDQVDREKTDSVKRVADQLTK
jgi:hypothetical protein